MDDRVACPLAGGERESVLLLDGARDLEEADDEQEQDRHDEREFDECLSVVASSAIGADVRRHEQPVTAHW